jgi:hypothetical protein
MRKAAVGGLCVALSLAMAGPVGAERAAKSNGVGVCLSQVAIASGGIGWLARSAASPGTPGSDVPTALDGARNACGEPPGPGHLG